MLSAMGRADCVASITGAAKRRTAATLMTTANIVARLSSRVSEREQSASPITTAKNAAVALLPMPSPVAPVAPLTIPDLAAPQRKW